MAGWLYELNSKKKCAPSLLPISENLGTAADALSLSWQKKIHTALCGYAECGTWLGL